MQINSLKMKRKFGKEYLYIGITLFFLLVVFLIDGYTTFQRVESIVVAIIIIVNSLIIYLTFRAKKIQLHILSFFIIMLMGGLSVLIQPVFNIPDEGAHFARAEMTSRFEVLLEPEVAEYNTIQAYSDLYDNFQVPYNKSNLKGKNIDYTPIKVGHIASTNASFLYFPQAIGIGVAKILHLNLIWLLWLGRGANLLFYAMCVCIALKIMPKFQLPMLFIAGLPLSIQQAASLSPDAMINGLAFLLIGFYVYLLCTEGVSVKCKEIVLFIILSSFVSVAKVTNIFLVCLFLTIPKEKFEGKKFWLWKIIATCLPIIIGLLYYGYVSTYVPSIQHQIHNKNVGANSSEQIQFILNNFIVWVRNFCYSILNQMNSYVNMLSQFGWLDYQYSILNLITIFYYGKLCFQEKNVNISNVSKGLVAFIVLAIYGASCLALYVTWTPVGAKDVLGVQGRYFIPILALLPIVFAGNKCKKDDQVQKTDEKIVPVTIVSTMLSTMLIVTAVRYF